MSGGGGLSSVKEQLFNVLPYGREEQPSIYPDGQLKLVEALEQTSHGQLPVGQAARGLYPYRLWSMS